MHIWHPHRKGVVWIIALNFCWQLTTVQLLTLLLESIFLDNFRIRFVATSTAFRWIRAEATKQRGFSILWEGSPNGQTNSKSENFSWFKNCRIRHLLLSGSFRWSSLIRIEMIYIWHRSWWRTRLKSFKNSAKILKGLLQQIHSNVMWCYTFMWCNTQSARVCV